MTTTLTSRTTQQRVAALLALALVVVAAGAGSSAARVSACRHADVVFYTTDTVRLAAELAEQASSCADYYLTVTPTATGAPRGDPPVSAVHSLGPRFHALAEIRLNPWAGYARANGWYAAGLEVRRQMRSVGYDASRGDSWAVNEVGAPSGTQMGIDVLKGTGTARKDLRDFVRGLYVGDDGVASRGLVFAADPLQIAGDLSEYRRDLRGWYADSAFWQDMRRYVRFWAQETYADARTWGVDGSTLAQRAAYLNDYFLHGSRLAAAGDGTTDAARAFFATAYTPVGNASYRWPNPDARTGIGFGSTDTTVTAMLGFVSAQTYTLRSVNAQRFGFAFVPRLATPTDTLAVADRVAAAIRGSETDPAGACGGSGLSCNGALAGAASTEAWKPFANTLEGGHVVVRIGPKVKVTFRSVTARGATQVSTSPLKRSPPLGFRRVPHAVAYDIATTAAHDGPAEVCVASGPSNQGPAAHLFRLAGRRWSDVTTLKARSFVCGRTPSLGTFAIFSIRPPISLRVSHLLEMSTAVLDLRADAGRAAVQTEAAPNPDDITSRIAVWNPAGGLRPIAHSGCDYDYPIEFQFAGGHAAWICDNGAAPASYDLNVGAAGSKTVDADYVYRGGAMNGGAGADDIGNLAGDGSLLVYNTWWSPFNHSGEQWGPPAKQRLWRVVRGAKQLVLAGTDALDAVSVDAGRIAVLRPDGTLVILNEKGKKLSSFRLGTIGADSEAAGRHGLPVRLTGSKVVVLRGNTVEVRSATSGKLQHRWSNGSSLSAIRLEDAEGNFAVYTAGIAIHLLRLSDGRDRVLAIPTEEGPAHAALEPEGLYYSYNSGGSTKPGRVAFVSRGELAARFR